MEDLDACVPFALTSSVFDWSEAEIAAFHSRESGAGRTMDLFSDKFVVDTVKAGRLVDLKQYL
jgi:hypothetical protein